MGYSFRLAARVLLYASSHRQDNTYHSLCYTSHGALAGTRNSSIYIKFYGVGLVVKDHSDSEREETGLAFFDQLQGIFYMHHPTDRIAHTMASVMNEK